MVGINCRYLLFLQKKSIDLMSSTWYVVSMCFIMKSRRWLRFRIILNDLKKTGQNGSYSFLRDHNHVDSASEFGVSVEYPIRCWVDDIIGLANVWFGLAFNDKPVILCPLRIHLPMGRHIVYAVWYQSLVYQLYKSSMPLQFESQPNYSNKLRFSGELASIARNIPANPVECPCVH